MAHTSSPSWLALVALGMRRRLDRRGRLRALRELERRAGRVPEPARQVFVLHRVDGVPIALVARRLNRPAEEIEALLVDALVHLAARAGS